MEGESGEQVGGELESVTSSAGFTVHKNLLEVLVDCKRVAGPRWYKCSGCRKCAPKTEYFKSIVAGHLPMKHEVK